MVGAMTRRILPNTGSWLLSSASLGGLMRSSLILFFLSVTSFLFAQPSRVPEIQYQSVPDLLKLPPDLYLGEVAGVAVTSKRIVFLFYRCNRTVTASGSSA